MRHPDIELLINAYTLKQSEIIGGLEKKVLHLEEKNNVLEEEIVRLKELLQLSQHQRFGKKSESTGEPPALPNAPLTPTITVAAHTRKKKKAGRLTGAEHLPHYQKVYDLSEHEKVCAGCQNALHLIGKEATKQLEIIPSRYCVIEHIQMKYACRQCETIHIAPKPLAPLPKAMAGASVLADLIINKYQAHLPLYRQSKMMKNEGVFIPDNTLGNWVMAVGAGLEPVYQAMWVILKLTYLQVDETPVKILEPDKKGYLWTYYAPHIGDGRGLVVFELSETRAAEVAETRLQSFNGLLQTDGYAGYGNLRKRKGIVGLGCFTHARRKFAEVVKITGNKNGIAALMLNKMKPLYALEARMRAAKLSFHTRKRLRQKIAWPMVKEMDHWLRSIKNSVLPKSKLGLAIQYTLNQWPYLIAYLRHGIAEIDTNNVENKIRDIALGKKNWLFIGNTDTGLFHAVLYSLVLSAILNDLNPRAYIHYLITQIHHLRKKTVDPAALLPHTIDRQMLAQFVQSQIQFAKQMLDSS